MALRKNFDKAAGANPFVLDSGQQAQVRLLKQAIEYINADGDFAVAIIGEYDADYGFCVGLRSTDGVHAGQVQVTMKDLSSVSGSGEARIKSAAFKIVEFFGAQERIFRSEQAINKALAEPLPQPKAPQPPKK